MLDSYVSHRKNCFWIVFLWLMFLVLIWIFIASSKENLLVFQSRNNILKKQNSELNATGIGYLNYEEKLSNALHEASENRKTILLWNPLQEKNSEPEKMLSWNCGSCTLTSNMSKLNDPKTASVVFLYIYTKPQFMPRRSQRRIDQLYVFRTGESPSYLLHNRKKNFKFEDEYKFNATMSYRRDSDIYQPYFSNLNKKFIETNLTKIILKKTKFSLAVVSNCDIMPGSKVRLQYLKRIQLSLPLDGFGNCFWKTIAKTKNKDSFIKMLEKYKFYFAFENSYHCRDYITEKFFLNGIRANTLPIVMGPPRKDYEAIVPPESFIHIEDFSSMDKLVKYLKYLNSNDTAYLDHFRWRTHLKDTDHSLRNRPKAFCQLCRIINGINVEDVYHTKYNYSSPIRPLFTKAMSHRTIPSLSRWIKDENIECLSEKFELSKFGTIIPIL